MGRPMWVRNFVGIAGLLFVLAASFGVVEAGSTFFSAGTALTADVEMGADLEVSKNDDPDPVLVGETLTYTVVVTNHGPSTTTAELTDTLPASVTFVSATTTAGSCGESGGTVTCSLGILSSGASATSTIEVIPTATGTITNSVSVTGDVDDPEDDNNTAIQHTTVGGADLQVSKVDDPDPVMVGETLTYTVVVTNHGPATTTAELTDTLPGSVTFVSATTTAGSCGESDGTVTCMLGILNSGEIATTTIEVIPTATGSITNSVSVTGDVADPDSGNNTAVQHTTVGGADLDVSKDDDPDPVMVGETLTYTVVVTNHGPATTTAVLTDTLPASVTFVSATTTAASCVQSGGSVTCSLGTLASGSSATSTIEVIPTATGTITNSVSVTGDVDDPEDDNNTAIQHTTVGGADLEVSKVDDPDPVMVGETLTYTVVVTNHGPSTTTAELTDTLPASVTFVSATTTAGSCGESGGTVTCSLGILSSGASATSTIEVIPTATGTITNSVSVTGDVDDPEDDNNTAIQHTTVGGADLQVSKVDDPDPVMVGETLTYTVVVTNHGPATTTAELTDTLPGSVTFVSATTTAGSCGESDGTVTCMLGILNSGEIATTTIEVIPTATGSITNSVSVTGDVDDPEDDNNTAIRHTTVGGADLQVSKVDDPDPVMVGETLTYTVLVTNHGPSTTTAVLTDTLPASVTFVSATTTAGSCGESDGTVTCMLGILNSGEIATTTIEIIPTATGSITNSVSVTGDVSDPDSGNNTAVQHTTVGGADLEVSKHDDPDPVLVGETLTYTVVVTNHGPATTTAVLTDTLPASVTFVSATTTAGSCGESDGTVTCMLGILGSGASATSTIQVIPTATGTITNSVSVTGDVADPDAGNNTATQHTTVVLSTDCDCTEGLGFWKKQFKGKGKQHIDDDTLESFLGIIRRESGIFDEAFALSGIADANRIFNKKGGNKGHGNRGNGHGHGHGSGTGSKDATTTGGKRKKNKHDAAGEGGSANDGSANDSHSSHGASTATTRGSRSNEKRRSKALTHTLAAWLNFAKGAIDRNEMVDTNGDGVLDTTFGALVVEVEAILVDPNATKSDLEHAKDLAEAVNSRDEDNPDCTATHTGTGTRTGTHTGTGTRKGTHTGTGTRKGNSHGH